MSDEGSPADGAKEPSPRPAEAERPAREDRRPKDGQEGGEPGGAAKEAKEGKDGAEHAPGEGGADQEERDREQKERERSESRFREAGNDPRTEGEDDAAGAAATAEALRSAKASFNVHYREQYRDQHSHNNPAYNGPVQFGDRYHNNVYLGALRAAAAVFSGPVPEDELERLRVVYRQPGGFKELERALRDRRLLVLGAAPGSGRTSTALRLLDRVTAAERDEPGPAGTSDGATAPDAAAGVPQAPQGTGTVLTVPRLSRLDPRTVLAEFTADRMEEHGDGHGFVLEIPEGNDASLMPDEVHLDALAAALGTRQSYAVVVVASGAATTTLLSGRYGMLCPAASTKELLKSRLKELLGSRTTPPDAEADVADPLQRAVELIGDPEVESAVGLEELRPVEAGALAELLARHALEELTRDQLLSACSGLVASQAYDWFAGLDREIGGEDRPGVPSAATLMYPAAFRIALSVFNDSTHSIVAEAAHALAWELAVTREPERAPARALFCDDQPVALALSRAVLGEGRLLVADVSVPVRTVRFQGSALPTAVLEEVWMRHHAARGPVVRWLRSLADDARPQVRIRAAVAAGELCVHDFEYGYEQLIRPMATASGARRRMFAATALAQAVTHESHRSAIRALVRAWARSDSSALRWTAAVALGYGRSTANTGSALDLLARIAMRDDGEHLAVVSHSTVLLASGSDDMTVLRRIGAWMRGSRRDRRDQDLGLLCVARLAATRVGDIWDNDAAPDLAEYQKWPLALALTVAREDRTIPVADLLWQALQVLRSRDAVTSSVEAWLRRAAEEDGGPMFAGLERLLPLLWEDDEGREQLRWLINRMVEDEDDPLPTEQARRIWRTVEPGPSPQGHRERERV